LRDAQSVKGWCEPGDVDVHMSHDEPARADVSEHEECRNGDEHECGQHASDDKCVAKRQANQQAGQTGPGDKWQHDLRIPERADDK
jgi:hypothetical protein